MGKIEAGIPEDDPRNPAVIADNVGDNVGDCAGMAADLFETYAVTVVATMLLGAIFFSGDAAATMMMYPLLVGGVCIVASVIATFFVRLGSGKSIMGALYKGFIASAVISGILIAVATVATVGLDRPIGDGQHAVTGMDLLICAIVGLVVTGLIVWITEYYTGTEHRPVKSVAKACVTGHATNIIQGLAVSMSDRAARFGDFGRHRGFAHGCRLIRDFDRRDDHVGLVGIVVALDAFGPVTDNAGGIAEMANCRKRCETPPTPSTRSATPPRP